MSKILTQASLHRTSDLLTLISYSIAHRPAQKRGNIYMDAYEKIRCARKAGRPTAKDYISSIFTGFMELHGDRAFGDDHAVVGGVAWLADMPVTVIGIEKGHSLDDRVYRNFGCVLPEGYRKAQRLMKEAEKFHRPVICFVDTQGASCGQGAERRGAGEAIADNLYELMTLKTPVISIMAGEGGSGGALALAIADEVWMLENAYYSVVSPEACASILFKDSSRVAEAADHLKMFADDLLKLEIIEKIIPEPENFGEPECALEPFMDELKMALTERLSELMNVPQQQLVLERYGRYRRIGKYEDIV